MRAFIGVDRFKVHHVAHDLIFLANAVAAMHVTRGAGDIERFANIVTLNDGNHVRRKLAFVHQAANTQGCLKPHGNIGHHIGQLLLI